MSGKNRLLKSGKTVRLRQDFWRSRISARFGKSAGFRPEPEPKSGTGLHTSVQQTSDQCRCLLVWQTKLLTEKSVHKSITEINSCHLPPPYCTAAISPHRQMVLKICHRALYTLSHRRRLTGSPGCQCIGKGSVGAYTQRKNWCINYSSSVLVCFF